MVDVRWALILYQYKDATALALAQALLEGATNETKIAVVSAPSVFVQLKNLLVCVDGVCSREPCMI